MMIVVLNLFPVGVLQLVDLLERGGWHTQSLAYTAGDLPQLLEWLRFSGDLVFIIFGVVPIVIAAARAYLKGRKACSSAASWQK